MNEIGSSLDTVWMLLAAMLVFWMQPGFALGLSAVGIGQKRTPPDEKNRRIILSFSP